MSHLAKVDSNELATVSENTAMVSMFERMASDPNVDVDKLERLMLMRERAIERGAKTDYDAAMADMQPELPVIAERGDASGRYTYAKWEDINTQIKPVLMKYGFALTFRTDFTDGIGVTGVLSHRSGHREETSIKLPADPSGNKNAVQAVASSVSYGKRYTASALLNLTSHGEDDDAYAAVIETITDAQEIQINDMLEATGADKAKFLKWLKIEKVSAIPAKSFDSVMATLRQKEAKK